MPLRLPPPLPASWWPDQVTRPGMATADPYHRLACRRPSDSEPSVSLNSDDVRRRSLPRFTNCRTPFDFELSMPRRRRARAANSSFCNSLAVLHIVRDFFENKRQKDAEIFFHQSITRLVFITCSNCHLFFHLFFGPCLGVLPVS